MKRKTLLWILLSLSFALLLGVSIGMIIFYPSSELPQPEPAVPSPSAEAPDIETPEVLEEAEIIQEPESKPEPEPEPEVSTAPEISEESIDGDEPESSEKPERSREAAETPPQETSDDAAVASVRKPRIREIPEPVYWVERSLQSAGELYETLTEIGSTGYTGKIVNYSDHIAVVVGPYTDFDEAFSVSDSIRNAAGFEDVFVTIEVPRNQKDSSR